MISVAFRSPEGSSSTVQAPARLKETIEAEAISAAVELLAAYRVMIQPAVGAQARASGPGLSALGVVRFSASGMSGSATLGISSTILKRSNTVGTSDSDWVAELANQFFGRFKLKLIRGGFELWSMAPVGVKGRLLVTGATQPQAVPLMFVDGSGGAIALWMDIEIDGEVKFNAPASAAEIPSEGDVILF